MEQPTFLYGNEKRFAEWNSKLNDKDKIALISHTDLDGIAAAKVVNEVLNADFITFLGYDDLNKNLVQVLKEKKMKFVVFTDLYIKDIEMLREIEKFAEVLIIDHHLAQVDLNSERTVFLNSQGFCATYICYYLFSKIQNIEKLDWLVACACVADWQYFNNKTWMNSVYEKYNDKFVGNPEGIKKSKMYDLQWDLGLALIYFKDNLKKVFDSIGDKFGDIGDLGKYSNIVQKEIDNALNRFEKEKEKIDDGFYWEFVPNLEIGSIVSTIVSAKNWNSTVLIIRKQENIYKFSVRRQDKKLNADEFVKKLLSGFEGADGGGHVAAAGGHFPLKYIGEFRKRLGLRDRK